MSFASLLLTHRLKERVMQWRENNYSCEFNAISEILNFALIDSQDDLIRTHYLRKAQFEALETYWYLRLIEKTPHIIDLYKNIFTNEELYDALELSISSKDLLKLFANPDFLSSILNRIEVDNEFVKTYNLEILRETLSIKYPSYIFALTMGSGKTILIATIIATEFALAMEYPDKDFVKNALVFAPGKTIIGALKELADIPYEKVMPPRFHKKFLSSVKITYTKDGEKKIPIIEGSSFNIILTNTEKIRIQKPISKKQTTLLNFRLKEQEKEKEEIANLRLQSIASLPHLGIFSDEAHHTYGQNLDRDLKKVRKTVDYLANNTNVICVVNTTGTPYFRKKMLKDVVYWYSLSKGISDGILKEVKDNIVSFEEAKTNEFVTLVIRDFVKEYREVKIFDGSWSKLAIYFPQVNDLIKFRPIIEKELLQLGLNLSLILEVHSKSPESTKDLFNNRINDPSNPYRIFLLVGMGIEGWNCPSLFSTALARKLVSSNNFVLQAATRCLRQVPGNSKKAKIYLARENVNILDTQLQETFGESLSAINSTIQEKITQRLIVRKTAISPIPLKRKITKVVLNENKSQLILSVPNIPVIPVKEVRYKLEYMPGRSKLLSESSKYEVNKEEDDTTDVYFAAVKLSAETRVNIQIIKDQLSSLYPQLVIPLSHIPLLKKQIEEQFYKYSIETVEEQIDLAVVKKDGFDKTENMDECYFMEINVPKNKMNLLSHFTMYKEMYDDLSFHYTPYNFDSYPEQRFFLDLLSNFAIDQTDINEIYFTGAITDPKKTDIIFEYKDKNNKWRNYTPDFIIRKKNGEILIIEIKGIPFKDKYKEESIKRIELFNKEKLKYEIFYVDKDEVKFDDIQKVKMWIKNE